MLLLEKPLPFNWYFTTITLSVLYYCEIKLVHMFDTKRLKWYQSILCSWKIYVIMLANIHGLRCYLHIGYLKKYILIISSRLKYFETWYIFRDVILHWTWTMYVLCTSLSMEFKHLYNFVYYSLHFENVRPNLIHKI